MTRIWGFDRADLGAVMAAGVVGATLRWAIGEWLGPDPADDGGWFVYGPETSPFLESMSPTDLPAATLVANLVGCAVLGVVVALRRMGMGSARRLGAAALGFCGSLTTFSAFAVETAIRIGGGHLAAATAYAALSISLGAVAFWFGRFVVESVVAP